MSKVVKPAERKDQEMLMGGVLINIQQRGYGLILGLVI